MSNGSLPLSCRAPLNPNLYATVTAAKAFQILATILVSLILVLVIVAAFMQAPITGKLGLAAGIALAVTSVFQLIAFSLMAAFADKRETICVASVGASPRSPLRVFL